MTITCGRGNGWHKDIGKHYNEGLLVFVQPLPLLMNDGLHSFAENVHHLAPSTLKEIYFHIVMTFPLPKTSFLLCLLINTRLVRSENENDGIFSNIDILFYFTFL